MISSPSENQPVILMYHRISDAEIDPWHLCVSPRIFSEHLQWLASRYTPTRLLSLRLESKCAGKRRVSVTFDDGYADNLLTALPILVEFEIPATVFVVSDAIGRSEEFWWDQLEAILLTPGEVPDYLQIETNQGLFQRTLTSECSYSRDNAVSDRGVEVFAAAPGTRLYLFREVWELLSNMPDLQRRNSLEVLWKWCGRDPLFSEGRRPLRADELRELADSPFIEIGAHSRTHARLPRLPSAELRSEILTGKSDLETIIGREVRSFSYPFGQHNQAVIDAVKQAGFESAVTTKPGVLDRTGCSFRLPRLSVEGGAGDYLDGLLAAG